MDKSLLSDLETKLRYLEAYNMEESQEQEENNTHAKKSNECKEGSGLPTCEAGCGNSYQATYHLMKHFS